MPLYKPSLCLPQRQYCKLSGACTLVRGGPYQAFEARLVPSKSSSGPSTAAPSPWCELSKQQTQHPQSGPSKMRQNPHGQHVDYTFAGAVHAYGNAICQKLDFLLSSPFCQKARSEAILLHQALCKCLTCIQPGAVDIMMSPVSSI